MTDDGVREPAGVTRVVAVDRAGCARVVGRLHAAHNHAVSSGPGAADTHILLFMYHPHGRPSSAITWTQAGATGQLTPAGGTASDNKEDVYWIMYAPRTSTRGGNVGRELDGFVMSAWKNGADTDWTFGGSMDNSGACVAGGEVCLDDLTFILNPS